MTRVLRVLWAYHRAKTLRFHSRPALEHYQEKRLGRLRKDLVANSPYYSQFADTPIGKWPAMDKAGMLANFDRINTATLKLQDVFATALAGENSRDFKSALGEVNVGLSSGTSGQRGVFAISDNEAARWAGVLLAKMLPDGLLKGERVALFLRANSNVVYESVRSRWLTFRYFDLFAAFEENIAALEDYGATIIVAPAQVLRELALRVLSGEVRLSPKKVISVAEGLEPLDRGLIEQAFPCLGQIYQATEGFLACTCAHGTLHLNEEYLHIEPQWMDAEQRHFTPVITDFTRLTQPFIPAITSTMYWWRVNPPALAGASRVRWRQSKAAATTCWCCRERETGPSPCSPTYFPGSFCPSPSARGGLSPDSARCIRIGPALHRRSRGSLANQRPFKRHVRPAGR